MRVGRCLKQNITEQEGRGWVEKRAEENGPNGQAGAKAKSESSTNKSGWEGRGGEGSGGEEMEKRGWGWGQRFSPAAMLRHE